MKKAREYFFIGILVLIISCFFKSFLLEGKIPIPADTIIGMYHPFRDFLADKYPRGFPFKNFLITDPVRQQYPWRLLVIESWRNGKIPGWNPYNLSGTPLLANFQSAALYPLNIFFLILPFNLAWSILIILQPLLAGLFLYLFLRNLELSQISSLLGSLSFAFSGFMVAWLEWGTIGHTLLWLPLILVSIDKILSQIKAKNTTALHSAVVNKWNLLFLLSLMASFFAGHLQTAFYVILMSLVYTIWKLLQIGDSQKKRQLIFLFSILYSLFIILTLPQWLPTVQFIKLSARGVDLDWQKPGWFIPWKHLAQFFVPDFFGNPTTLNYWGEWNYGELIGFIGIIPLILAFCAFQDTFRNKNIRFFALLGFLALSFALPTPWAKLIYQLKIPFLNTSQPTRLLMVVDFCLAVLAAFGLEKLIKKEKSLVKPALLLTFVFVGLWIGVELGILGKLGGLRKENLLISRRNLVLPTAMLIGFWFLTATFQFKKLPRHFPLLGLLFLTVFDLLRFGWKFTPFSPPEFIFPKTKTIAFLKEQQKDNQPFRIMNTDKRILPPNFASVYQLEEIGGYDPLYLLRYGELIAVIERGQPNMSPPFGFNRIIVPTNIRSRLIDFLNVKYILSLNDLQSDKLELVFQEGETRVYENKNAFPRAFLVYDYQVAKTKQEVINLLMNEEIDLKTVVILEEEPDFKKESEKVVEEGKVEIVDYQDNQVILEVKTEKKAILVFSDTCDPNWQAEIDGVATEIYRANYQFRAIIVPEGKHTIVLSFSLWPPKI